MKALFAAALCLCAVGSVFAQSSATLKGIDVYRSEKVSSEKVEALLWRKLQIYTGLHGQTRAASVRSAVRIKKEAEDAVAALGDFAYVELALGRYVTSAEQAAYVTFDVVDRKDAATRMPFRPRPAGAVPDPEGLLAAWRAYSALGSRLRAAGIVPFDRPACAAYHCLWGSQTPELAAYEERFMKGSPANKGKLLKVLASDADPADRSAAVYLLSYVREGKPTADLMLDSLSDPSAEVRSAALQVLSDIVVYHREVFVEVHRLLPALDFPTVSDRSKSLAVLVGLADNPDYQPYLISRAGPRLLELLKQRQPSVHDLAYTILGMLSKESFPRRDYKAWTDWVDARISSSTPAVPLVKP